MRIVAITAGVSDPSSTRLLTDRILDAVAGRLTDRGGAEVRVIEVKDLAVDAARAVVSGFRSPELEDALDAVGDADALVLVTPVFTGSYSGILKTFLDLLEPDAIIGTPTLVAATGGSARHALVLEHALRPLLAYLRAVVVPTAIYAAPEDWAGGPGGGDGLPGRIDRAAGELAALLGAAHRVAEPQQRGFEALLARATAGQ